MGTESLRLRLVFEDQTILTKTQRSDGMNRTWILLKSQQHRTISDVCSHLLNIFKLNRSCPNGIILAMEGFALPPFESTEILKDKEIISVKKKGGETATIEAEDEGNLLDEAEDDGLEPRDNGLLLLANDNRNGEYESESEEVDEEQSHDEDLPVETVSKKRKAPVKLQNSKKKKQCLGVLDDSEDETETEEIENVASKKQKRNEEIGKSAATSNMKLKSPSIVKRSKKLQENAEEVNQVDTAPPPKKMASRSARRKKAKRQWMKELAKIGKKKPQQNSKPEVTKPQNKEANGQPKGLLHWKQASKQPVQNGDAGPAVTRPGHIRFESFDEDQPVKQTGGSKEMVKWSGSSSKKRGQKWGREKFSNFQSNVTKRTSKESFKVLFKDAQVPVIDLNDFDKLPPCSEPKEGDVIAYRLLELNSSWIPEFSSYKVGRISYYDARDIVLIPVPEYPISLDNMDEDGPNECLYEKDGTLEINYSALVDVRNLKQYVPDASEPVSNVVYQTPMSVDNNNAAENLVSNNTDTLKDSNPEGEVNPWDKFSKVISENTEMPEPNHSSKVGSGSDPCSSSVTVGPTAGQDTNKAESSGMKDGPKDNSNSSDPWLNASNPEPSQETNVGWTTPKTTVPSEKSTEKNCETGSSWGRPWSSFVPLKVHSVKQPTNQNDWRGGSSHGGGKPWSRGGGRGRGRSGDNGGGGRGRGSGGRGRGRGRSSNMM